MKRKFYIIAHNPNYIDDALNFLAHGANAIEPDLNYDTKYGDFFVYDSSYFWTTAKGKPTLATYCNGLAAGLINNPSLNLALIIWDMKNVTDVHFDFVKIRDIIKINFIDVLVSHGYSEIPMLFTHSKNFDYIKQKAAPNLLSTWALSVDDVKSPQEVNDNLQGHGFCYTYGKGYYPILSYFNFDNNLKIAASMRDSGNSFKLVYAWTINREAQWKDLLSLGIDGIITDHPDQLKNLMDNEFAQAYEPAKKEDNPFIKANV